MKPNKLSGMIGLCRKAGKLICGTELVCLSLRKEPRPCLVLLSDSASMGTKKKVRCKTEFYSVPLFEIPLSTSLLATAVGKSGETAVIAVTDANFAKALTAAATELTGKDEADESAPKQ